MKATYGWTGVVYFLYTEFAEMATETAGNGG